MSTSYHVRHDWVGLVHLCAPDGAVRHDWVGLVHLCAPDGAVLYSEAKIPCNVRGVSV